jgi:hypothetical protein
MARAGDEDQPGERAIMASYPRSPNLGIFIDCRYRLGLSLLCVTARLYYAISPLEIRRGWRDINIDCIACTAEASSTHIHVLLGFDRSRRISRHQWMGTVVKTHFHPTRSTNEELHCRRSSDSLVHLACPSRSPVHLQSWRKSRIR